MRRKISSILGYENWADYRTEIKMVKTSRNVEKVLALVTILFFEVLSRPSQFLDELEDKMRPVGIKDREVLLSMKKEEHAKLGLPFDGEFYVWDYRLVPSAVCR